jgi:hypothetical protein
MDAPFRIVGGLSNQLSAFDLLTPAHQSALTYHFGDSVRFSWQACHHPVPDTAVTYMAALYVNIEGSDETFAVEGLLHTMFTYVLTNSERYAIDLQGNWNVMAYTASGMVRQSTSTFSLTLLPGPIPTSFDLISPADSDTVSYEAASHLPMSWEPSTIADTTALPIYYMLSLHAAWSPDTITLDSLPGSTDTVNVRQYMQNDTTVVQQVTWWVTAVSGHMQVESNQHANLFVRTQSSSVSENRDALPSRFAIASIWPNPFNPTTEIRYDLPLAGHISLRVFDLLGREMAVLKDGFVEAGTHRVTFDGGGLASGIYFARLDAEAFSQTKKLMLLK